MLDSISNTWKHCLFLLAFLFALFPKLVLVLFNVLVCFFVNTLVFRYFGPQDVCQPL